MHLVFLKDYPFSVHVSENSIHRCSAKHFCFLPSLIPTRIDCCQAWILQGCLFCPCFCFRMLHNRDSYSFFYIYLSVWPACMQVCHVDTWCLWRSAEEPDSLELELQSQTAMSNHTDTKTQVRGKSRCTLNHGVIAPISEVHILIQDVFLYIKGIVPLWGSTMNNFSTSFQLSRCRKPLHSFTHSWGPLCGHRCLLNIILHILEICSNSKILKCKIQCGCE